MDKYEELEAMRADREVKRRKHSSYVQLFRKHPDCRDPDHPGCSRCIEAAEFEEMEDE